MSLARAAPRVQSPHQQQQRCAAAASAASLLAAAPLAASPTVQPKGGFHLRSSRHQSRVMDQRRWVASKADSEEPGSTSDDAQQRPQAEPQPVAQQASRNLPPQQGQRAQQVQLDENVWAYKPAWCQPYSILATGTGIVAGAWAISGGSAGWSTLAALPVGAWWYLFLVVYPAQFKEYVQSLGPAERQQLAVQLAAQKQQQQAD